jgi:hypothetical protein
MKTTNKALFFAFIISLLFLSVYAAFGVIELKEKIKNIKPIEFKNITCLKVDGDIFIWVYSKSRIRNYNEMSWGELKAKNLFVKQKNDTLELIIKGGKEQYNGAVFNLQIDSIKSIQVANYANVRIFGAANKDVKLIADENSGIFVQGNAIKNLEVYLSGEAHVSIDTCMDANVNLKGGSYLIFNHLQNKIKGVLYNRAFVDLDGDNYNASELVKKDSSAVVYRKNKVNGIVVRRLTY